MAELDLDRVVKLFTIVEKVATVFPGFVHLLAEASAELRQIDQDLRKAKLAEQGLPVTPAPVGDPESPPQPVPPGGSPADFDEHPVATQPLEEVKGPDVPDVEPEFDYSQTDQATLRRI